MIFILIGLPGSGKGTQGKFLAKKLKIPYLSTGDMIRALMNSDKYKGLLSQYVSSGKLVPSSLINQMIRDFMLSGDYNNGCILDGYPRSLEQVEFLQSTIGKQDLVIIFFDVDENIVVKRISGRFSCVSCGAIYNKYFFTTKVNNKCDFCDSCSFALRTDDDEATIRHRIEEYKAETLPVVDYYRKNNKLFFSVDASRTQEEISFELDFLLKTV